jgi:FtsP/CotA-like multicopper oxidase with cupredoxin domain
VIAMQFTDYSDDTFGYMLHCHNTVHDEDEGMMAMLMVMSS